MLSRFGHQREIGIVGSARRDEALTVPKVTDRGDQSTY